MANAPLIPKIPPIRTDIQTPQQSSAINRPPGQGASDGGNTASNGSSPQHRTSKEWYYYWSRVGDQVNSNTQTLAGLVTYGPHAGRPDPSTMPDGAIIVESDRNAIYQNELVKGVPTWRYVAGTMWGTLSPDQRPTDLGVNDAGFEFRSVDSNPDLAPRTFIWSQSEWIETTLVLYGTHANRPAADEKTPPRTLYVEEDRGNVMYQQQADKWMYIAGTMWGTLSPDQRPTDLGVNDAGFQFRATDQQREFLWSQTAWVEVTPSNAAQFAAATANLTLSTTMQDIPGAFLNLASSGRYWIYGAVDFVFTNDPNFTLVAWLAVNGTSQSNWITYSAASGRATLGQQWLITASSPGVNVKLQANKSGGTGTSSVSSGFTTLSAIRLGP